MLGGRCAEQLIFNEVSSGAANDLKQTSLLAKHMVSEWGMSKALGPLSFHGDEQSFPGQEFLLRKDYSEHTAELIDEEVKRLVTENEQRAKSVIEQHQDSLEILALALLERETLSDKDILELLSPQGEAEDPQSALTLLKQNP